MKVKGFTLLEVLIAMTIIALAFVSLFVTFTEVIGSHDHLKEKTYASWVADNVMNQATTQVWVEEQAKPNEGTSQMGNKVFDWVVIRSNTADKDIDKIVVQIYKNKYLLIETTGYTFDREPT